MGSAILLLATATWGTSFVVMKSALASAGPGVICFGRFAIAAIVLSPFLRAKCKLWLAGGELGVWLFSGYASQTIGLRYTTVNRSAFITAMTVVLVPMIVTGFGRRIRRLTWAAALVALVGCGLLSYDGSRPNIGDAWTLVTALTFAVYIARMSDHAKGHRPLALAATQLMVIAALSGGWVAGTMPHVVRVPWGALIYLGLLCTAVTTWMQAVAQSSVSAPTAAVIFTMEPVFAAILAYWVRQETLGPRGLIGAGLILVAAIASQFGTPDS